MVMDPSTVMGRLKRFCLFAFTVKEVPLATKYGVVWSTAEPIGDQERTPVPSVVSAYPLVPGPAGNLKVHGVPTADASRSTPFRPI